MDNPTYIGLDIGKYAVSCAVPGRRVRDFNNDRPGIRCLLQWCGLTSPPAKLFFVMEATGGYCLFTASTLLDLADTRVAIVPPVCIASFIKAGIKRTKTDRADAEAIRRFGEVHHPAPWFPRLKQQQRLRDLLLVFDAAKRTVVRLKCLKEKLATALQPDPFTLASLQRQLDSALAEQRLVAAEMDAVVSADEVLSTDSANMLSIPGVGPGVRNVLLALIGEQLHALSQRKLLAYCGLSPQENQSGKFKGRTMLNKAGDPRIRQILYMAALRAVSPRGILHDYFQRLKRGGKHGKSALVHVMRKLLYLIQALVKSGKPFDRAMYLNPA